MKNNFFIPFKGKYYKCGVGTKKKKISVITAELQQINATGFDN